ncbi:hypothetical protein EVAR_88473_1 [Eumeta japonica]|uniref:Uncharacterized protein n=1 Tax=Eumeta variegata TaxID=151549 RepID=A0A4C1XTI8_EUMVA|nr:hypothetical protein EVAR_88473_1 [Eumeta japonica]
MFLPILLEYSCGYYAYAPGYTYSTSNWLKCQTRRGVIVSEQVGRDRSAAGRRLGAGGRRRAGAARESRDGRGRQTSECRSPVRDGLFGSPELECVNNTTTFGRGRRPPPAARRTPAASTTIYSRR